MADKKRIARCIVFFLTGVILTSFFATAFWPFDKVDLSPSQNTDVSVQVGNAAPTVAITSLESSIPLSEGTTYSASIDFEATDANGVNTLDDSSVSIVFAFPAGGPYTEQRTGSISDCTPSTLGNVRTYDCDITMQYFDSAGTWDVTVSVSDTGATPLTSQDTSTTTVNLLKGILLTAGSPIGFGTVAPGQNDVTSPPTTVKNNGNYEGTIDVTAYALYETGGSNIPAANFNAAGSNEANVCAGAGTTTLIQATQTTVTSTNLEKGDGASENMKWCLDVPSSIVSAAYSTSISPSQQWTIAI